MDSTTGGAWYSARWFRVFLDTVSAEQTRKEVEFLTRQLPLPGYARVLDLFCGAGRHALALAGAGYAVTGLDREAAMIRRAREARVDGTVFVEGDVRDLARLSGPWDAVLMMWSSFGQFADRHNAQLLDTVFTALRPAGRLLIDVYDRDFFEGRQGERTLERAGARVLERKWLEDDRLHVELHYGDGTDPAPDRLSWQVFAPDAFARYVQACGFAVVLACSDFDEARRIAGDLPRMQWVLERPHAGPEV